MGSRRLKPLEYGAFAIANTIPVKTYRIGPFNDLESACAGRDLVWGSVYDGFPRKGIVIAFVDYWDSPETRGDKVYPWEGEVTGDTLP